MNLLESLVPSDFRRALDAPLRRFFLGVFVNCFAIGLTLSLYVVYLHNVLHFSTSFSTLLLGLSSFAGLISSPLWGTLTDRIGPVKVLVIAGVTNAGALIYWAYIQSERSAIIGGLVLAIFGGAGWGPGSTLLVRLVASEHRQRAYGFNFMLVNFGIGCGGLVSASVVDLHHPLSFRWLYLGNALVSLVAGGIYITLWKFGHEKAIHSNAHGPGERREGWAEVLRDRRLVLFVLGSIVLMLGGYSAVDAGLSLFVVNNLHLSVHVIGIFLFVDTSVIVLAQLFVINVINGRSRTRILAVVGVMWAFFWGVLALSLALRTFFAILAISLAMIVFAIGETMLSPVGPAIVNEIAPEHLRGRYNAAQGLSWGLSSSIAPAIIAAFFDNGLSNWWPLSVGVLSLSGGIFMLTLRRHLSASQDGRAH
ncbi:MAG: MFS transporter [Acidimicrobiaceae bacterium]|nr:MFS transporter [Acidimicrobiaceae bacterium]